MKRRTASLAIAALLARSAALAGFGAGVAGCGGGLPASRPHPLLSKVPEQQEQPTLEGTLVKFPQAGKITVIDFWSTVCEPCLKMMPAMEQLHRSHKAQGLRIIGVAVDDNPGIVDQRLKKLGVTYTNLLDDASSSVRGAYQVDELPQTFIFDRAATLRVFTKGGDDADVAVIRQAVEYLLAE